MATRTCLLSLQGAFLLSFGIAVFPAFCAEDALKDVQQTPTTESDSVPPSRNLRLTWDSPRLQEARKEWEDAGTRYHSGSSIETRRNFGKLGQELDAIVSRHFTTEDMRDLVDDVVNLPVSKDAGGWFASYLVDCMVERFVDEGDRKHLVLLLAVRCPSRVRVNFDVAGYLAIVGKKLTDPILILDEAYAESKTPENRKEIAETVRRGFADWKIQGKDDGEFVRNAMQWYREHKEEIVANEQYVTTTRLSAIPYIRFPLFIKRDSKLDEKVR